MNQAILSKSGLQPQLIRHNTSVDGDAPNQSLVLSVNGLWRVNYSITGWFISRLIDDKDLEVM